MLTGAAPRAQAVLRRPSGRAWAVLAALLLVGGGLAAGAAGGGGAGSPIGGPDVAARIGTRAPALSGTTLAGTRLDLAALRGSVVVVDVWAAWCAPCRDELPLLAAAQRRLGPRGLRVVGIDVRDGSVQARRLLAGSGGDPAASVADPTGALAAAWDVRDLPQTFVLDRSGTVRAHSLGAVTADWLDGAVGPLLAGQGAAA